VVVEQPTVMLAIPSKDPDEEAVRHGSSEAAPDCVCPLRSLGPTPLRVNGDHVGPSWRRLAASRIGRP
jgi:hypothetical protein